MVTSLRLRQLLISSVRIEWENGLNDFYAVWAGRVYGKLEKCETRKLLRRLFEACIQL